MTPTTNSVEPTTSATDELRRMLDERGVEWWQSANTLGCIFTRWHSPIFGDEVVAMENGEEGLVLFDHFVTPEQAIAATLGRAQGGGCMSRTDIPPAILAWSLRRMAGDGSVEWVTQPIRTSELLDVADMLDENTKLRELCVKALEWLRWAGGITCPPEVPDEFADELRELGIEVEA